MTSDHPAIVATKHAVDAAGAVLALATLAKILPALAALLACIWYIIRISEWIVRKVRGLPGEIED